MRRKTLKYSVIPSLLEPTFYANFESGMARTPPPTGHVHTFDVGAKVKHVPKTSHHGSGGSSSSDNGEEMRPDGVSWALARLVNELQTPELDASPRLVLDLEDSLLGPEFRFGRSPLSVARWAQDSVSAWTPYASDNWTVPEPGSGVLPFRVASSGLPDDQRSRPRNLYGRSFAGISKVHYVPMPLLSPQATSLEAQTVLSQLRLCRTFMVPLHGNRTCFNTCK